MAVRQVRKPGQGFQKLDDPGLLDEYRRKGQLGHKASAAGALHCIEGEYLTTAQIGERLGRDRRWASSALSKARQKDGPVTWARLQGNRG